MSADDPTSPEYANQQEINRLNKAVDEARKVAQDEIAQAKADSDAAASAVEEDRKTATSEAFATMKEDNAPAREALLALHAGEPLQDAPPPPPPEVTPYK